MRRLWAVPILVSCSATAAAQGRPIAGVVVTELGPAAGAKVVVSWLGHPELPSQLGSSLDATEAANREVVADGAGRFRVEPPHPGPFLVRASSGSGLAAEAFPVMPGDYVHLQAEMGFTTGGVVTSEGLAVTGAEVWRVDADPQASWRRAAYRLPGPNSAEVARTGVDGRFELAGDVGYLRHPIWFPLQKLAARAPGDRFGLSDALRPIASARSLEIALVAPAVRLEIVGEHGPVGGARLIDGRHALELLTDEQGRVAWPFVGSSAWCAAPGHGLLEVAFDGPAGLRRIEPERARRWMVGVLRHGGVPLRHARVLVSIPSMAGPPLEFTTATAADGSLDLRGLPDPGLAYLSVEVEGLFHPFLRATGPVALASVDVPELRLVKGQVLDADGVPAGHARVVMRIPGWPSWVTWSDHGGRFRFDVALPAADEVELGAQADGRGLVVETVARESLFAQLQTLRCAAGRDLEGRVVDPDGRPVPRCYVTASQTFGREPLLAGPSDSIVAQVVFTDAEGRFTFHGLRDELPTVAIALALVDGVRLQATESFEDPGPAGVASTRTLHLSPLRD